MTSREFSGDRLAMSILMYFMYYWYAKDPGHLLLGLPASSLGAYGVICKAVSLELLDSNRFAPSIFI